MSVLIRFEDDQCLQKGTGLLETPRLDRDCSGKFMKFGSVGIYPQHLRGTRSCFLEGTEFTKKQCELMRVQRIPGLECFKS